MRITRRQLRDLIFEIVPQGQSSKDEPTGRRIVPQEEEPLDLAKRVGQRRDPFSSIKLLPGGPIDSFKTEPVASGRYNVGYDPQTMDSVRKGGGVDQADPDAVSPGPKHSKKLFVVDPTDRDREGLEPRAALQNDEPHDGSTQSQDIHGVLGDPIPAYIDGYVHTARVGGGKGGTIVILATAVPIEIDSRGNKIYPQDTEFIRYGHLNSIAVGPGDIVRAGDTIADLGCTGSCGTKRTSPHIHLTVSGTNSKGEYSYRQGNRNPYDIFDKSGWITNRKDLWVTGESKERMHLRHLIREELNKRAIQAG